jgi:hypothetical protein
MDGGGRGINASSLPLAEIVGSVAKQLALLFGISDRYVLLSLSFVLLGLSFQRTFSGVLYIIALLRSRCTAQHPFQVSSAKPWVYVK